MSTGSANRLILFTIVVAIAGWLTWPSGNGLDLSTCEPSGIFSRLSLTMYQDKFWQAQLDDIAKKIQDVEGTRSKFAKMQSAADAERQRKLEGYEKYMAPTPAQLEAERLRNRADQVEAAGAFRSIDNFDREYLAELRKCEAKINSILR